MKHIPGHGLAKVDSHHFTPFVNKKINYLIKNDFFPFKNKKTFFAMTAHIVFNQIDINQPSNKSAYEISSKNNVIDYKKLVDEEGIISILITFDSNDKPKSIIAYGIKKNFLFNSYRNYKLSFDSIGNLTNYIFEDKQIRIFNDTLLYKVSGNVIW